MNIYLLFILPLFALATTSSIITKRNVTKREAGGDDCIDSANAAVRDTKHKLRTGQKSLDVISGFAGFIGPMLPGVGPAIAGGIGGFAGAIGSALGLAEELQDAPSEELEQIKCLREEMKEEFKKLNATMMEQFNIVKQKLDEVNANVNRLREEMKEQFHVVNQKLDDLKQTVEKGFDELMNKSEMIKQILINQFAKQAFNDYNDKLINIYSLLHHVSSYLDFGPDMSETKILMQQDCSNANPYGILLTMDTFINKDVLDSVRSEYTLVRAWCNRIYMDLVKTIHAYMICYAAKGLNQTEKGREREVSVTETFAKSIIGKLENAIKMSMDEILTNATHYLQDLSKKDQEPAKDYVTIYPEEQCAKYGDELYNHLAGLYGSLFEWVVEETVIMDDELAGNSAAVYGDNHTRVVPVKMIGSMCQVTVLPCERHSFEGRNELVHDFEKWATTIFTDIECPGTREPPGTQEPLSKIGNLLGNVHLRLPQLEEQDHTVQFHKGIVLTEYSSETTGRIKLNLPQIRSNNTHNIAKGLATCGGKGGGPDQDPYKFWFFVCF